MTHLLQASLEPLPNGKSGKTIYIFIILCLFVYNLFSSSVSALFAVKRSIPIQNGIHRRPSSTTSMFPFSLFPQFSLLMVQLIESIRGPIDLVQWKGEIDEYYCPHAGQGSTKIEDLPRVKEPRRRRPSKTVSPQKSVFWSSVYTASSDGDLMLCLRVHCKFCGPHSYHLRRREDGLFSRTSAAWTC